MFRTTMIAAGAALFLSGAAFAQTQEGLVNVNVAGNNVQVPIGVAAQVCPNVSANVLAQAAGQQEAVCEITQEVAAENNIGGQQGGGGQGGGQGGGGQGGGGQGGGAPRPAQNTPPAYDDEEPF